MAEIKTKKQAKKYFADLKERDADARASTESVSKSRVGGAPHESHSLNNMESVAAHENTVKKYHDEAKSLIDEAEKSNVKRRVRTQQRYGVFDTGKK